MQKTNTIRFGSKQLTENIRLKPYKFEQVNLILSKYNCKRWRRKNGNSSKSTKGEKSFVLLQKVIF